MSAARRLRFAPVADFSCPTRPAKDKNGGPGPRIADFFFSGAGDLPFF